MYDTYRSLTGFDRVPDAQQYWCLAGRVVAPDNPQQLLPLCEPKHAVETGLITPEQYIGVEIDPRRGEPNLKQAELPLALVLGDLSRTMRAYRRAGNFRPGLINLDTNREPQLAVSLLEKVYIEIQRTGLVEPVVIFLNVVMDGWRTYRDDALVEALYRNRVTGADMLTSGWKMLVPTYEYHGTTSISRAHMKMYCLFHGIGHVSMPAREIKLI